VAMRSASVAPAMDRVREIMMCGSLW